MLNVLKRRYRNHPKSPKRTKLTTSNRIVDFNTQHVRSINPLSTRWFHQSASMFYCDPPTYTVHWILKDGSKKTVQAKEGDHLLEIAHKNDIELEGACEASLACSTCHVIVTQDEYYDKLSEPSEEEEDMLDLAFALTDTSRLGCQVYMSKELDGITVKLPQATRNMAVDGYTPHHH
eukprot:TRINITY_DN355_c0_g1_i1.p1 TRINITY_DN355_c0_g1~~TRINITY_DN355_c0_g1_i1.p1  ORF type:complete len:177 (-),score=24.60 TRINITY_DN355_c0_g1_i1:94-624(-)